MTKHVKTAEERCATDNYGPMEYAKHHEAEAAELRAALAERDKDLEEKDVQHQLAIHNLDKAVEKIRAAYEQRLAARDAEIAALKFDLDALRAIARPETPPSEVDHV